jgi:hypothetical protein
MAAMRCEGIAALGDERAIGFGMGYSRIRRYWPKSTLGSGARAIRRPVPGIRRAGTSFRRQAFDPFRAMGLPRKAAQAINAVVPAVLPFA